MILRIARETLTELRDQGRRIEQAQVDDPALGPFAKLPGTWVNVRPGDPVGAEPVRVQQKGWNMIALPFGHQDPAFPPPYRLLLNRYNERLEFTVVDKAVPNRGIGRDQNGAAVETDQSVVTLDYEQVIQQTDAADFPDSGLAGGPGLPIHHEPGLLLTMLDQVQPGEPTIARLATIPHGDAALALGTDEILEPDGDAEVVDQDVPVVNALPIGVAQNLDGLYLRPYRTFRDAPFAGLFDPTDPTAQLRDTNADGDLRIRRVTRLEFDTTVTHGGIHNIPFVVAQVNASEMRSTFWIQEVETRDEDGQWHPGLRLQYVQVVQLDFFPRTDGGPGRIKWPHVSVNTLEKL